MSSLFRISSSKLLAPSDEPDQAKKKMEEYRENGVRVAILLDPVERSCTI